MYRHEPILNNSTLLRSIRSLGLWLRDEFLGDMLVACVLVSGLVFTLLAVWFLDLYSALDLLRDSLSAKGLERDTATWLGLGVFALYLAVALPILFALMFRSPERDHFAPENVAYRRKLIEDYYRERAGEDG